MAGAVALAAAVLFASAFAVAYVFLHAGRIAAGTQVAGVALDGLDRAAAEAELRRRLPDLGADALTLAMGGVDHRIDYSEIGRDYDYAAMLDAALSRGHQGSLGEQLGDHLRAFGEGTEVPLVVAWDRAALAGHVAAAIRAAETAPVDAVVAMTPGGPVVRPAIDGARYDVEAAIALAEESVRAPSPAGARIVISAASIAPAIPTEQAEAAAERARRLSAQPLRVLAGAASATISSAEIRSWTTITTETPGSWRVALDRDRVDAFVAGLKAVADVAAIDGSYAFDGYQAVLRPATNGYVIDPEAAATAIDAALLARADGTQQSVVSLERRVVAPTVSTQQARELVGRVRRISSWTTLYEPSSRNGFGVNITRPTELIDGTVLEPGEQFDFVAVAGPITPANGYTDGAAIINGNTRLDGVVGGGLCSASTTVFNAALRAGFQIDARRAHAYYIDRYPVGLDATIWVSGRRVQTVAFTNDSPYPILIRGLSRRGSVTFEIYGVPDGRRVRFSDPVVTNERAAWTELEYTDDLAEDTTERVEYAFAGFNSVVTRTVVARGGDVLHEDTFRSSYRRVIGLIRLGRGPDDPPAGTRVVIDAR